MILWPPRSIYPHSPWLCYCLTNCHLLFRYKRTIWLYRHGMNYDINWLPSFYRILPSHIYSGVRCGHTRLLHISHHNHHNPNQNKMYSWLATLQTRYQMIPCNIITPMIYLLICSRGTHKHGTF
ncbi:hypothetical protein LEMLEM_LOCUS4397 [Lemmus lemmus]